jgi:hypothetical protein
MFFHMIVGERSGEGRKSKGRRQSGREEENAGGDTEREKDREERKSGGSRTSCSRLPESHSNSSPRLQLVRNHGNQGPPAEPREPGTTREAWESGKKKRTRSKE